MNRYALLMAGGSGTRFWPKSTQKIPKQFLALTSDKSLLWSASNRLTGIVSPPKRWVVCTKEVGALVKKQIKGGPVLCEPEGRNTMAAVCWGAWAIYSKDPQSSIVVLPADAHIGDEKIYKEALQTAFELAETENRIVCLGIKPTFAATGYGYIENKSENPKFIEKPDQHKANELVASGDFLWNAGIFVFKTKIFIDEVRNLAPEFAEKFDQIIKSPAKLNSIYKNLPKTPVDKAVMEKTSLGAVVPCDCGWNDVGSWQALHEVVGNNSSEGLIKSKKGFVSIDCKDIMVDVTDNKFVGLVGVNDLVVVETKNALLICHKDRTQEVKDLVDQIRNRPKLKGIL